MSNYDICQASSTSAGSAVIPVSIIGIMIFAQLSYPDLQQHTQSDVNVQKHQEISIQEHQKTHGQYNSVFQLEYEHSSLSFEEAVTSFYANLLANQEPLGKEFEQVLYDNLWDLLVST
jgi:hypothetical protein